MVFSTCDLFPPGVCAWGIDHEHDVSDVQTEPVRPARPGTWGGAVRTSDSSE